jgi:hypothetical protein
MNLHLHLRLRLRSSSSRKPPANRLLRHPLPSYLQLQMHLPQMPSQI